MVKIAGNKTLRSKASKTASKRLPAPSNALGPPRKRSSKHAALPNLDQIRDDYRSAGYEISGVTSDGVIIIRPDGLPDSFKLRDLRKAVAGLKPVRSKIAS